MRVEVNLDDDPPQFQPRVPVTEDRDGREPVNMEYRCAVYGSADTPMHSMGGIQHDVDESVGRPSRVYAARHDAG